MRQLQKKPNNLQEFFIICSGANREIVNMYPLDWNKYTGIGSAVFFTALLASLSGGYAMYEVFKSFEVALLMGLLWGIIIFSLDRYIVSSMKKPKIPSKVDILLQSDPLMQQAMDIERKELLKNQFYSIVPRFFMAIIIALTISKPVELRIFDDEINIFMAEDKEKKIKERETSELQKRQLLEEEENRYNKKAEDIKLKSYDDPEYNGYKEEFKKINKTLADLNSKIQVQQKKINENIRYEQVFGKSEKTGADTIITKTTLTEAGKIARNKREALKKERDSENIKYVKIQSSLKAREQELNEEYKSKVDEIQQELQNRKQEELDNKKSNKEWVEKHDDIIEANQGFSVKLEALDRLSKEKPIVNMALWIIMLLFLLLETSPIIMKLLTPRGFYDEEMDRREYVLKIEIEKEIFFQAAMLDEYKQQMGPKLKELADKKAQYEADLEMVKLENKDAFDHKQEELERKEKMHGLDQNRHKTQFVAKFPWVKKDNKDAVDQNPKNNSNSPTDNPSSQQPMNDEEKSIGHNMDSESREPVVETQTNDASNSGTLITNTPNSSDDTYSIECKWEEQTTKETYIFEEAGLFTIKRSSEQEDLIGTWEKKDSQISITLNNATNSYEIVNKTDSEMTLKDMKNSNNLDLKRV